ncbi:MAG: DotU family type IV/VI secretion system protein [Holosporales bacterium]|jgi:type VI secretion system protein ImpK|nr:DotU family type IV/VI secretion system protein [Holosporales bacterium]
MLEKDTASIFEQFFVDFYYELLKCKELAIKTIALDNELDGAAAVLEEEEVVAGGSNRPAGSAGNPATSADSATSAEGRPEKAVEPAADTASANQVPIPANSNQYPTAAHSTLAKNIPVHSVRALEEIQDRLKKVLTEQAEKVVVLFQFDLTTFREVQYAMVALADEVFLGINWKGRSLWQNLLLEGQVFHSQSSGETIFSRIELILSRYDQAKTSLARIYLFILTLGFKGKYNDFKDAAIINSYKKRLYTFIYGINASIERYGKQKIAQQCYDYTVSTLKPGTLPDIKFWTKLFIFVIGFYAFISYMLWYNIARDFYVSLDDVFDRFSYFMSKKD